MLKKHFFGIGIIILIIFFVQSLWLHRDENKENNSKSKKTISFPITNKNGEPIGFGIPIQKNILVAPDHLFTMHQDLFYQNTLLPIKLRDFEHDLLFLETPFSLPLQKWSSQVPLLGETVFYFRNQEKQLSQVEALNTEFYTDQSSGSKKNLLLLQGLIFPGESGTPLQRDSGEIVGMMIGADSLENKSYALRADVIWRIAQENDLIEE